jgi:hypothetical protein
MVDPSIHPGCYYISLVILPPPPTTPPTTTAPNKNKQQLLRNAANTVQYSMPKKNPVGGGETPVMQSIPPSVYCI